MFPVPVCGGSHLYLLVATALQNDVLIYGGMLMQTSLPDPYLQNPVPCSTPTCWCWNLCPTLCPYDQTYLDHLGRLMFLLPFHKLLEHQYKSSYLHHQSNHQGYFHSNAKNSHHSVLYRDSQQLTIQRKIRINIKTKTRDQELDLNL